MTKKTIFDVDGIGDFNNPELLRPLSEKLPIHDANESANVNPNSSDSPKTQNQRRSRRSSRHNEHSHSSVHSKRRKPTWLWVLFSIITSVLVFIAYTIYTKHDSSLSKLILDTQTFLNIALVFLAWIFIFTILLFITNKKLGIIFVIFTLLFSNASVFKANEILASFQKLFDTSSTPAVLKTSTKNILTEPFTVLVLGVDSEGVDSPKSSSTPGSGYNSDTMILVTVNPKTHKADMVTTPRDAFLNDSCTGNVHKLTEFIGGGVKCTIDTLETLYNIKIDYFVQANFTAVVQIVDALGGIEVDVPNLVGTREQLPSYLYWVSHGGLGFSEDGVSQQKLNELIKNAEQTPQWCDVDSKRNPYAVCFSQFGKQTVDGEHALAFARSRHYDSDYARGMRQTEVIRAIIQKMASPAGLLQIQSILEKLKNSYGIETNMTFSQMTDIMSYAESLSGRDTSNFQVRKYQPLGTENKTYTGSGIVLYKQSIIDIRTALATTLELIPPAPLSESEYYDTIEYPSFKTN